MDYYQPPKVEHVQYVAERNGQEPKILRMSKMK